MGSDGHRLLSRRSHPGSPPGANLHKRSAEGSGLTGGEPVAGMPIRSSEWSCANLKPGRFEPRRQTRNILPRRFRAPAAHRVEQGRHGGRSWRGAPFIHAREAGSPTGKHRRCVGGPARECRAKRARHRRSGPVALVQCRARFGLSVSYDCADARIAGPSRRRRPWRWSARWHPRHRPHPLQTAALPNYSCPATRGRHV